jgi:hypothetical protein
VYFEMMVREMERLNSELFFAGWLFDTSVSLWRRCLGQKAENCWDDVPQETIWKLRIWSVLAGGWPVMSDKLGRCVLVDRAQWDWMYREGTEIC